MNWEEIFMFVWGIGTLITTALALWIYVWNATPNDDDYLMMFLLGLVWPMALLLVGSILLITYPFTVLRKLVQWLKQRQHTNVPPIPPL